MLKRQLVGIAVGLAIADGCSKKKSADDSQPSASITATADPRARALVIHMDGVPLGLADVTIEGIDTKKIRTERPDSKINSHSKKLDVELDWSAIPSTAQELTVVVTERTSPTKSVTTKATVKVERPLTMTLAEKTFGAGSKVSCHAKGLSNPSGLDIDAFFPSVEPTGELVFDLAAPVAGKLEVDGKTHTVEAGKAIPIRNNIVAATIDKPVGDETPHVVLRAKLTAQGRTADAEVSCTVKFSALFREVWDKPFVTPGETAGPAVAMVSSAGLATEIGKAKTGRDYHLLARSFELPRLEKPCGTYVNKATGESTALKNSAARVEVRVKDRRTGEEVAKKEFSGAIPPCAKKVEGKVGDVGTPNKAAIDTWLASILTTRSKT